MNTQYFDNIKRQQQLQQEQQHQLQHTQLQQQPKQQQQLQQQQQQLQQSQQKLLHQSQHQLQQYQQQPSQKNQRQPQHEYHQRQQYQQKPQQQQPIQQKQLQPQHQQQMRKDFVYEQYPRSSQRPDNHMGSYITTDSAPQNDRQSRTQSSAVKDSSHPTTISINNAPSSIIIEPPCYPNSNHQVITPAQSDFIAGKSPRIEAKYSNEQVPYGGYTAHESSELKEKILKMDQENTNLRNQLIENSENILLLQATLQASDKECEANIKTAIEQKDSELLFKEKQYESLQRDYQKLVKELTALKKAPSTQTLIPAKSKAEDSNVPSVVQGSGSDSVPVVRSVAAVVTAPVPKERTHNSCYSSPHPIDEVGRAITERRVRRSVIILHELVSQFEQLLVHRGLFQTDSGLHNATSKNSTVHVAGKLDLRAPFDIILESISTILRESLLESRLLNASSFDENRFLDSNFARLLAQLTRLLQCLLALAYEGSGGADDDGHAKKMNPAIDLCLSMLTLLVDSPFLDRPSAMEDISSDEPHSNLGLNLIEKFDQVATTSASASTKKSVEHSSHHSVKRPRLPEDSIPDPMSDEDDEVWGFPLAAVSGLSQLLSPRSSSKSSRRRTAGKVVVSSTNDSLSLLATYLQHAWSQWVDLTASAGTSTAALLAGLICRTCQRAMECRSFREDSPLVVLALRVLVLEHIGIGIGMPEKIALLIALEAKMQRMRFPFSFFRSLQKSISVKRESAAVRGNSDGNGNGNSVEREETTKMQADFESQFIFKLTSIVCDIGSTAELLRFQIQIVAFLLALLSTRSDILVAAMIGLPVKILEEAAEKGTTSKSSVSLTESERKRHRQDNGLNQLLRSCSSTRPQQTTSQIAIAKPLSQWDTCTPQPHDSTEEDLGDRFDWSPYMLPTSELSPHKHILHGLCRRWIDLTRQMDRTAATWSSADLSGDLLLRPPSQAEVGQLQAILVVRIAELLNGIAGRLLYPQWAALMQDMKLDVNSFIVRWHINLHPSIRTRLPASSLQNLSLF